MALKCGMGRLNRIAATLSIGTRRARAESSRNARSRPVLRVLIVAAMRAVGSEEPWALSVAEE